MFARFNHLVFLMIFIVFPCQNFINMSKTAKTNIVRIQTTVSRTRTGYVSVFIRFKSHFILPQQTDLTAVSDDSIVQTTP